MKRHLVVAAAALGFAFIASGAHAQFVDPVCGFEHPKKAKETKSSMVQAFVSCGNVGGNVSNSTTEGGVPSCAPPETFNDKNGGHPTGWMWDETKGAANVSFKAAKNKIVSPLDPPGDTADVAVSLKLAGIVTDAGPANSNGVLSTLSRATFRDRQNTPGDHTDDKPMTVIDFAVPFSVTVVEGKGKVKTTANATLNGTFGQKGLPHCTSIEVLDISINDVNGNRFASLGTFLPAK